MTKQPKIARKVNRRKQKRNIQLGIFLVIVILVTFILLYMFTNISYVKEINIHGNRLLADKKVHEILNVDSKTRLYEVPAGEIAQNLKLQDGVKDAKVKRIFPNKVDVAIEEYRVVGIIPDGDTFHPVLENGQELKMQTNDTAPILRDFGRKELKAVVRILDRTSPAITSSISEINYIPNQESSGRVQFFMNDGLEVIGDIRTLGDKLNYYPSMAKKVPRDQNGKLIKPGIIDLEVGSVFIPYESKKAEERRMEMESEAARRKEEDSKKLESSINDLKKQLEDIKKKDASQN